MVALGEDEAAVRLTNSRQEALPHGALVDAADLRRAARR